MANVKFVSDVAHSPQVVVWRCEGSHVHHERAPTARIWWLLAVGTGLNCRNRHCRSGRHKDYRAFETAIIADCGAPEVPWNCVAASSVAPVSAGIPRARAAFRPSRTAVISQWNVSLRLPVA